MLSPDPKNTELYTFKKKSTTRSLLGFRLCWQNFRVYLKSRIKNSDTRIQNSESRIWTSETKYSKTNVSVKWSTSLQPSLCATNIPKEICFKMVWKTGVKAFLFSLYLRFFVTSTIIYETLNSVTRIIVWLWDNVNKLAIIIFSSFLFCVTFACW